MIFEHYVVDATDFFVCVIIDATSETVGFTLYPAGREAIKKYLEVVEL